MSGPLETVLAPAHAGTWHLDTDQSTCRFTVRDKLVTTVHGTMPATAGIITIDGSGRVTSAFVEVGVKGIATGNSHRDADLAKPHFLDLAHHPTVRITVEATGTGEQAVSARSVVEARGVHAPITLEVQPSAQYENEVTLSVTGRLDRRPLGIRVPTFIIGRFIDLDAVLTFRRASAYGSD